MAPELAAVRQQAARLAQLPAELRPACFALVPFSSAGIGPVRVTSSAVDFQQQLETVQLVPEDRPRLGVSALITAADIAPAGSDIYIVTDHAPSDASLHLHALQLIADAGSRVNLILTGGGGSAVFRTPPGAGEPFGPGPRPFGPLSEPVPISAPASAPLSQPASPNAAAAERQVLFQDPRYPLEVYKNMTKASGGLLVEVDKSRAAEVLQALELAANNTKATLLSAYDVGFRSFSFVFGVDQTVSQLEVIVSGTVESAQLIGPRGTRFDLRSPQTSPLGPGAGSAGADAGQDAYLVRDVISSAGLRVVQLDLPVGGDWRLDLASPDVYYPAHVAIRAITTLDVRASVVTLADRAVTHPGMQVTRGRLVTGDEGGPLPHVLLQIISIDSQPATAVEEVVVTDLSGNTLLPLEYNTGVLWDAYLPLNPAVLNQPVNVRVSGRARDGSRWVREAPLRATLSSVTLVPVRAEASVARQGQSGDIQFQLTNEARLDRRFDLYASDSMGFFQSLSETSVTLSGRQSRLITLRYFVPPSARAGDSATLLVSAVANLFEDGAAAHQTVTVLGQEEDVSAPTCTVQPGADVDCGDYLTEEDCNDRQWTVEIVAADSGAGIHEMHVFPSSVGQLTADTFVAGIQQVRARYRASCCHPKANITVVDRLGNFGTCIVNLGDVRFGPLLSSTSLALVIAAVLLLLLLIVLITAVLAVRRRRRNKSHDLPRMERHRPVPEDGAQSSHM